MSYRDGAALRRGRWTRQQARRDARLRAEIHTYPVRTTPSRPRIAAAKPEYGVVWDRATAVDLEK